MKDYCFIRAIVFLNTLKADGYIWNRISRSSIINTRAKLMGRGL
jgi:hypothetical protein